MASAPPIAGLADIGTEHGAGGAPPAAARVPFWRDELKRGRVALREAFFAHPDTPRLLREHARLVDRVVRGVWRESDMPAELALVAVGGYGRGQLFPHSDVDVLILLPEQRVAPAPAIERFFATLWDVGLELSHAVRTVAECGSEMAGDITIRTSLLENRYLHGARRLMLDFRTMFAERLDVRSFYAAKTLEQQQRHQKCNDAIYNLEPNVKESPGGLRDLQTVLWISRAAGLGKTWAELARHGLMTIAEARAVSRQERFIGAMRVRLHYLSDRREDRLVFDQQAALGRQLHLVDTPSRRASEQLMQRYYRAAKLVRQVNIILLQNLHARLHPATTPPVPFDAEFQTVDELLDVRDEDLFSHRPAAMLDAFLMMQKHRALKGMTARTLRALWRNRRRIDASFRRDPANRARFIEMFRIGRGLLHELRRMNLFGILGQYLPSFGRIVGQMQHDLFHVYAVDEHILMVIRNLRRFTEAQHAHEYPTCSRLIADFERREVLYLAGLFHDIAKGRGGNHSKLGARRGPALLPRTRPVEGRRRPGRVAGAGAPDDVHHRAEAGPDRSRGGGQFRAQGGYAAAPVRAVPADRCRHTRHQPQGMECVEGEAPRGPVPRRPRRARGRGAHAHDHGQHRGAAQRCAPTAASLCRARRRRSRIVAPSRHALFPAPHVRGNRLACASPLLARRPAPRRSSRRDSRATAPACRCSSTSPTRRICSRESVAISDRSGLSILEAKVHTTRAGYALDTFAVLDPTNPNASYRDTIQRVEFELSRLLAEQAPLAVPTGGRISRQLKHFPLTPDVQIFPDDKGTHYILEVVAGDRPGLLARIAYTLARANINVVSAKINTLGGRAEDVFLIDGARLHDEQALLRLETALFEQLSL